MNLRFLLFLATVLLSSLLATAQQKYNYPSNFYEAGCVFKTQSFEMTIVERGRSSSTDVSTYYPAMVGDIDNDGFGEIVIPGGVHNYSQYIYVFNHKAKLLRTISLPPNVTMHTHYDSVILADLNNDEKGEIIVTASNGNVLLVYDNMGTLLSSTKLPTKFPKTVGVADFNNDGKPEIYVGNAVYGFYNNELKLLATGNNTLDATIAQDIDNDGIPELVSANKTYKVDIQSTINVSLNSVSEIAECTSVSKPNQSFERTFALADIDLDGTIDVISVVPVNSGSLHIEIRVWNPQTGELKHSMNIARECTKGNYIKNSWPFIGDTDGDGYPDIVFMGGVNSEDCTYIYRLEYDSVTKEVEHREKSNEFKDFTSMSTSMSMFDFNNDGAQEIVYRDQTALYILNGKTLAVEKKIGDCFSGTGWEYPVVASLTPSGESSIIMSSGADKSEDFNGSLRIYGADIENGAEPWTPARKMWNQYAFYQNTMYDDLKIISNPYPLNATLTSTDGKNKTLQPFNGHMLQLGIIKPSTLESVYPLANVGIDKIDFGYNRIDNQLEIYADISNTGDAAVDPEIPINLYKFSGKDSTLIHSSSLDDIFHVGDKEHVTVKLGSFDKYLPFDSLKFIVAEGKYDCNSANKVFTIYPSDLENILYVKKGTKGNGSSWIKSMGELNDALVKAKKQNEKVKGTITEIWVAEGTYIGGFEIQDGVNVYGGFYGEETKIDDMRPLKYPTILDAQFGGRVLTQLENNNTPTEWKGLTIQNGKTSERGAGALLKSGMSLVYSVVRNNTSTSNAGAGVYADNSKVINCIIEYNTLKPISTDYQGGGAGVYAINNSSIINNTVVANAIVGTKAKGAGLYAEESVIANNIVYKNVHNGGISNAYYSQGIYANNLDTKDDSTDPLFVNMKHSNYRLLPNSPALNIGENKYIHECNIDIDGNRRIYEERIVDQGAFEYQAAKLALNKEGYFFVNKMKEGDGSSWQNATTDLRDALVGAQALNENAANTVTKIWVAKGTYRGSFEMVEGANVHGGFSGVETDFNQMDTVSNKTYIDAEHKGRGLTQTRDYSIPTEWAGLIIQNGNVEEIDNDVYGGGAYLKKNGILRFSTIRNSKATAISRVNKVSAYGGGVYLESGASMSNSIVDNNLATINDIGGLSLSGVAQGGGVFNNTQQVSYCIIRNNMTKHQGNTDGAAIYSIGDIANSIISGNIGSTSAIHLSSGNVIVNSTVVGNIAKYTFYSDEKSKIQNTIVFDNNVTEDFVGIDFLKLNNLINIDPVFEANSFRLKNNSPARVIGNASFLPANISVDMDNAIRVISIKDNVKIVDVGAYQSKIKIKEATAPSLEVSFGTNFADLDLSKFIPALLEFGYHFDANVRWVEGDYNKLIPGEYTLFGDLHNLGEGVTNVDNVPGIIKIIVKKNHNAKVEDLTIGDQNWMPNLGKPYTLDCDYTETLLPITLQLPLFATVVLNPELKYNKEGNEVTFEVDVTKPGTTTISVIITSQDGLNSKEYVLTLVKKFPFWSIVEQRWNNTFVANNNKENNGGYEFESYKWYKGVSEIGTKQYYSAGGKRTDVLDESSLYRVELVGVDGMEYSTCEASPVLMYHSINVYPNPVGVSQPITIEAPMGMNKKGTIEIYSLGGDPVKAASLSDKLNTVEAPSIPGLYVLKVSIAGGVTESMRLIVR